MLRDRRSPPPGPPTGWLPGRRVVVLGTLGLAGAVALGGRPTRRRTTLDPVPAWTAGPGEVQPEVKLAASAFCETAGTWAAPAGPGHEAFVAEPAVASATRVLYPQYGGLDGTGASVMCHVRQVLLDADGSTRRRDVVLDVRLAPTPSGWAVVGVADEQAPLPAVPVSELGRQVLAHPGLRLSGSARADVRDGVLDDRVAAVLLGLAAGHVLDVHELRAGHPLHVFGTERVSNHSQGRAADVRAVDGHLVVDPATPAELLTVVMQGAAAHGATEVGGPFDLNGPAPGFFTDDVHRDHLHLGVSDGRSPAGG